jgi:hypothetical protein
MDKYADRLDDAANEATGTGTAPVEVSVEVTKAKTRPDDEENDPGES